MQRYLAHKVIYGGKLFKLAVVTISDDSTATITPFERETASTAFVDGTIYVVGIDTTETTDTTILTELSAKLSANDKAKIVIVKD